MSSTLENNKCFFRDNNQKFLTLNSVSQSLISQLVVLRLLSSGQPLPAANTLLIGPSCASMVSAHRVPTLMLNT
ncbi:hypothetical protein EJD97_024325 [Solanum chilense]|uniref:Uncharacterized protein n=1 Tax=Solanum chilense TaxID=4083 RepID=A0A6N2C522_SOLCI|nr:hypothetical protein EJD97_024325 [Solanum chilense]